MAQGTKIVETEVSLNTMTLTIKVVGKDPIVIHVGDLTTDMVDNAILHGLKQKICDAASGFATPTGKYDAMREVADRLIAGEWSKRGEGSGAPTGLLLKALIRLYPAKDREALVVYLAGKDKTEQAALRKTGKIAAMIETIKAESAKTSGVDSDALLDELEGI